MAQNAALRCDLQVTQTAYENERDKYARLARGFSSHISARAREYETLRNAHTASVAAAAKAFADLHHGLKKTEDEKKKEAIRNVELFRSLYGRDSLALGEIATRKGLLAIEPAKLNTGAIDMWKGFAAKHTLRNVVAQPVEDAWICSICTRDNTGGSECWTCNASRGGLKRKRF